MDQKVIRAPQLRLRFGRNDPLWSSFNENALLEENFEKRAPSQRLRWGRSNLFGNLVNQVRLRYSHYDITTTSPTKDHMVHAVRQPISISISFPSFSKTTLYSRKPYEPHNSDSVLGEPILPGPCTMSIN